MSGIVVLVSGSGSNLQKLIDARQANQLPEPIRAVISNRPDAYGLQRAEKADIETRVLSHTEYATRALYDEALARVIDGFDPDLVVLAGFMRILSAGFVDHYRGRMLNIHPSLLPAYRGLHTHRRVLEAGESTHGCSVHFVTPDLDAGPVVAQAVIPVADTDTEESLAARVQTQEHRIYPLVVRWFAEGRLRLKNDIPWLDGRPLTAPVVLRPDEPLPA